MAIDIKCPHCTKSYRLKDEMAGKKVQCANQECRKPFAVEPPAAPTANGTAKKPAAPPPPPKKPVDADELAAAALADAERAANPTLSVIHMTCSMCEHKWDVPVEMQGKNVLCPDCKHRQKVPIPKDATKQDWRVRQGPQGAKLDRLEGVSANTDASSVSGQTLLATGVVKIEYEPRPASFYAKIAAGVLVPTLLLAGFLVYNSRTKKETAERVRFEALIKDSAEDLKALPVYRGVLRAAAARYEATLGQPAGGKTEVSSRDKAVADIQQGVGDLKEVAKGYDRDFLFGELASAAILLGGEGEDLKEKRKLSWLPPTAGSVGKNQIRPNAAELLGVQGQLRQVFEAMLEKGGDFDARAAVARRVARELIRANAPNELIETFAQPGFGLPELFEVDGQIGLECLRAGNAEMAGRIADRLAAQLTAQGQAIPAAVSAQALCQAVGKKLSVDFTAGGSNTDASRMVQVSVRVGQNKPDEAVNLAKGGGGTAAEKFRALAVAAEGTDSPQPAVEAAAGLVAAVKAENGIIGVAAYRLACAAARCGADPEPFLGMITDETLRPWAKAEVLRLKLAADKSQQPGMEAADLPTDPKNFRGGHAWAALAVARHNAAKTGENKLLKEYAGWPKPFGYLGQAGPARMGNSSARSFRRPAMPFDPAALAADVEAFCRELRPVEELCYAEHRFNDSLVPLAKKHNLLGMSVPEEYGGRGADAVSYFNALTRIGREGTGPRTFFSGHLSIGAYPIQTWGSDALKRKYLPAAVRGEKLLAFGLTEPDAGSNPREMTSTYRKTPDGYVLNGVKYLISNGGIADAVIVFGYPEGVPDGPARRITAFVLDTRQKGFTVDSFAPNAKMGMPTSNTAMFSMEECAVPAENRLGEEGDGFRVAMGTLVSGRLSVAAGCLGVIEDCLTEAVEYAKTRSQHGKEIARHQLVQDHIARIEMDRVAAESLLLRAAEAKQRSADRPADKALASEADLLAAKAKFFATNAAWDAADRCVQVFGGRGWSTLYRPGRHLMDVRVCRIYEGTDEVLKLKIAASVLGKEYEAFR